MNTAKTDTTIRELTTAYINAIATGETTRVTYLRMLVEETQRELGATPHTNNVKRPKLSEDERIRQRAALEKVHTRFYTIVNDVVDKSLGDVPSKARPLERNRRTNFARTAVYAARLYIRAGKDLTGLAPGKLTKSAMAVAVAPATPSPRRLKGRVERASKAFVTSLLALGEADKGGALAELETLMGIMASQLAVLGAPMARDLKHAVAEHKPFRSGPTLFVPTATTVIRQMARPS